MPPEDEEEDANRNRRRRAQQQREDEDEQQEEQQRSGIWDWLRDHLIPDFSFGGIIMVGLMLTGLYFFAKSEPGQGFIKTILENFSPETQIKIAGFLNQIGIETDMAEMLANSPATAVAGALEGNVSSEVLGVITPDDATSQDFFRVLAAANGGDFTLTRETLTSDKTIMALVTQRPQMVQKLAAALKGSSGAPDKETMVLFADSLKKIVADERLDVLLSAQHRPTIANLLHTFAPRVNINQLTSLLATGVANGKATPAFRTLLTSMLTLNEKGELPDKNAMVKAIAEYQKVTPTAAGPAAALVSALSAEPSTAPTAAGASPAAATPAPQLNTAQAAAVLAIAGNGGNIEALRNKFLTNGNPDSTKILNALLDRSTRTEIIEAGTKNIATLLGPSVPFASEHNLNTLLHFGKEISENTANLGAEAPRTNRILSALMSLTTKPPAEAFKDVAAEDLSGFFLNPRNHQTFYTLIKNLDISRLPAPQRMRFAALKRYFGDTQAAGLNAVLADPTGAAFMLEELKKPPSTNDSSLEWSDGVKALYLETKVRGVVGDNADTIIAFTNAMQRAEAVEKRLAILKQDKKLFYIDPSAAAKLLADPVMSQFINSDRAGGITNGEIIAALRNNNVIMSADRNGDGLVTFEEVRAVLGPIAARNANAAIAARQAATRTPT